MISDNLLNKTHPEVMSRPIKFISWRAVFVGTLVALGLTFLFNLLTIALDLSLYTAEPQATKALTLGTVLWLTIGGYITLFIAGWVTGRLIAPPFSYETVNGFLHGFVVWSLYLLVSLVMVALLNESAAATLLKSFFMNTSLDTHLFSTEEIDWQALAALNRTGYAALATFFIFLMGAAGCCMGGACGIKKCQREQREVITPRSKSTL